MKGKTDNFIISKSEKETVAFAEKLGKGLKGGETVTLSGDLGAGKTVFAKGLAKGLGIKTAVVSPTFTILRIYEGRLKLFHFDMYRITSVSELEETGFLEALSSGGVCVIEWAENIAEALPEKLIRVSIEKAGKNERRITVEDI